MGDRKVKLFWLGLFIFLLNVVCLVFGYMTNNKVVILLNGIGTGALLPVLIIDVATRFKDRG